MKKVKWGVIGAGGIADRRTIPGMLLADNAELVSVMEIDTAFAQKLCAKYGAKRAYTRAQALVEDPEIDAVYIASPVFAHAQQAMAAAEAGKHILIEKPLALSSGEGKQILERCAQQGILIAAGFMMRFGAGVRAMRKAVLDGKIGHVVSGYAQFTCWYPDLPNCWRQNKSQSGGGALVDMGVHCIDLMQYVTGSPVKEVSAFNETLTFHYDVEDTSLVILRLENGAVCTIQSNFNIPDDAAKWRLEFFGTQGRLLGDQVIGQSDGGTVNALFLEAVGGYDAQQAGEKPAGESLSITPVNTYQMEIESFSNSVLTGAPLEAPASDAVQVQQVIEAAYRSSREKRTILL